MELEQVRLSADQLRHLSTTWSPWLDICHFILSTLAVREEVGLAFSRYLPGSKHGTSECVSGDLQ
jgi:hypothetical protein